MPARATCQPSIIRSICSDIPASATPSKNRTALADALLRTKAKAIESTPKVIVYNGIALPGPIHFVKRFAGISKIIYLVDRRDVSQKYCGET